MPTLVFWGDNFPCYPLGSENFYNSASVYLSVCLGLVGQNVSSRILQLGTFDQHDERKMPIVFQGEVLGQGRIATGKVIGRIQNEP